MSKDRVSSVRKVLFIWFPVILGCLLAPPVSFCGNQVDFTPSITVSETYNDNIYLNSTNERSDYIMSVSPGFDLSLRSEKTELALHYSPSFVRYNKYSRNDTVRHSGRLNLRHELGPNLELVFSDSYTRSEEPIEEQEDIQGVRNTRNTYWRNNGNVTLRFTFGPENVLSVGYGQSRLENEDLTIDDSLSQNAFSTLTYWFNEKHGLELTGRYIKADFWRDDTSQPGDDYDGYESGIKYLHRFNPHSTGFVSYTYSTRDFEGNSEDYDVHDGNVGITHTFSPNTTLTASAGYFVQKNTRTPDESGLDYSVSLSRRFERGDVQLIGQGGWSESYQDAERRGFTRFRSGGVTMHYQLLESLSANAGARFRWDKEDQSNRKWNTFRGNLGLSWNFMRWF
ncbi:MAG: outer membrane beta-barrel protein, partial [Deltaproteobacteria bacterium]|nr:outer membrane beta-barrel protein [Deltaproteobacteria bacterium]